MAEILTETQTYTETTAIDWLSTLEDKVRAAAERIRSLSEENTGLRGQIAELEQRLAAASSTDRSSADPNAARWQEERREIRERVERLTRTLEELVEV